MVDTLGNFGLKIISDKKKRQLRIKANQTLSDFFTVIKKFSNLKACTV